MRIRPIAHSDLADLQQIAVESGPGFTSLVNDRDLLEAKIQRSLDSFARRIEQPGDESYLFVLEDTDTGEVMGITGIKAGVGLSSPLYHYHKSQVVHHSQALGLTRRVEVLNMCNHYTGCSEVCTLFLRPRFRRARPGQPSAGKLLSRVRFLFMAQHPERFAPTVIAEMRGVSDAQGRSPFWDWFQTHFVDLDFATVNQLVGAGDNGFIAELMPKYPLYGHLLSPEARAVIGQVHDHTRPALRLLEAEGFRHKGYVDLFDGGPTVEAELDQIRSVRESVTCQIQVVDHPVSAFARDRRPLHNPVLLANTGIEQFRATVTDQVSYLPQHNLLQVPTPIARSLGLAEGATARFMTMNSDRTTTAETVAFPHSYQQEPRYAL